MQLQRIWRLPTSTMKIVTCKKWDHFILLCVWSNLMRWCHETRWNGPIIPNIFTAKTTTKIFLNLFNRKYLFRKKKAAASSAFIFHLFFVQIWPNFSLAVLTLIPKLTIALFLVKILNGILSTTSHFRNRCGVKYFKWGQLEENAKHFHHKHLLFINKNAENFSTKPPKSWPESQRRHFDH